MSEVEQTASRDRRWWVGVAAAAGVAIAITLATGVMLTPEKAATGEGDSAAQDVSSIALAALESIGIDGARVLGVRHELEAAFERRRDELPSEAATSVDESLALLDGNIAELSAALERDPGNPELARLLASAYRRQVEMLRTVDRVGPQNRTERAAEQHPSEAGAS